MGTIHNSAQYQYNIVHYIPKSKTVIHLWHRRRYFLILLSKNPDNCNILNNNDVVFVVLNNKYDDDN